MDRDEWIAKRAIELQKEMNKRIAEAEYYGWPNHDNDDCSHEEAEEEWNQMYGYPDEN